MARRRTAGKDPGEKVADYRHKKVKRLNIPPAGLAARGDIVKEKKIRYAYNPHLSPVLRFDPTGKADGIKKLLDKATRERLEPDEIATLEAALRNYEPWLEWSGDPPPLVIPLIVLVQQEPGKGEEPRSMPA